MIFHLQSCFYTIIGCGYQGYQSRVVGGTKSKQSQWPWQASLRIGGSFNCGATLIAPQWIVTAGHCIKPYMKANKYSFMFGEWLQKYTEYFHSLNWWKDRAKDDILFLWEKKINRFEFQLLLMKHPMPRQINPSPVKKRSTQLFLWKMWAHVSVE